MQYENQTSDDQQELTESQVHSENEGVENRSIPIENQIVGYNAAQDQ
jgi:hypothetical protein